MSINPETQYPGKINPSDASYPYGSARNITVPGDGTGTPWEAAIVNDLLGWQQALLTRAGIVPSGSPDTVLASQYLEALISASGSSHAFVAAMVADTTLVSGQLVRTVGYSDGWAAMTEPEGGAFYGIATLQEVRDAKGEPGYVPDDLGDHTLDNALVAVLMRGNKISSGQFGPTTAGLDAALSSGASVVLSRDYTLTDNVELDVANRELIGNGFTLDCTGTVGGNTAGVGGGLLVSAQHCLVDGVKFVGNIEAVDSVNFTDGRLIRLEGGQGRVRNCQFVGSNGGGVSIVSDANTVRDCQFDRVNNRSGGTDAGSVHVSGGVKNKVLNNNIEGQFYAGVGLQNSGVGSTLVQGNYIKADQVTFTYSMGIFCLDGANRDSQFLDNQIIGMGNEGIIVFSKVRDTDGLIIKNNIIRDCIFAGIFLNQSSEARPSKRCVVTDNVIYPKVGTDYTGLGHIVCEQIVDSVIRNNVVPGNAAGRGIAADGVGVLIQQSGNTGNIVSGNNLSGLAVGVNFAGLRSVCTGNTSINCGTGVAYTFCNSSQVTNNTAIDCDVGFAGGTDSLFAYVALNTTIECTKTYTGNRGLYGHFQREGSEGATRDYGGGTLVAGTVTINFFHVESGDVFVAMPDGVAGSGSGSLDVLPVPASNQLVVSSTDAADTRSFVVLRLANAITP